MIRKSISKNSTILGAFALVTAGLIAFTFQGTEARINESERRAAQKALLEIVPEHRHDNDLLSDVITLTPEQSKQLGLKNLAEVHVAKHKGEVVAFIIPSVASDGYSGDIKFIAGVNTDGSVAGVRVLAHKETPGLGDKVDLKKSDWILGFNGKSLNKPKAESWKVKKDGGEFDQFTGATITPRAVVRQLKEVLTLVNTQQAELIEQAKLKTGSN